MERKKCFAGVVYFFGGGGCRMTRRSFFFSPLTKTLSDKKQSERWPCTNLDHPFSRFGNAISRETWEFLPLHHVSKKLNEEVRGILKYFYAPFFDAIEIKETFGKIVPLTRPKENCVNTPISHKRATKSNKSEKGPY